jgi:hypothetical protein
MSFPRLTQVSFDKRMPGHHFHSMRILSLMICLTLSIGVVSAEETADLQISTGRKFSLQGVVTIKRGGKPAQGARIRLDFSSSRRHDEFLTGADGSAVVSIQREHTIAFVYLDSKNFIRYQVYGAGLPFPLLIELPEFEVRREATLPSEVSLVDNRERGIAPLDRPQLVAIAPRGWRYEAPLMGTVALPYHEGIEMIGIDLPNSKIAIYNISPFKSLRVQLTNTKADQPESKAVQTSKSPSVPSDAKPAPAKP